MHNVHKLCLWELLPGNNDKTGCHTQSSFVLVWKQLRQSQWYTDTHTHTHTHTHTQTHTATADSISIQEAVDQEECVSLTCKTPLT